MSYLIVEQGADRTDLTLFREKGRDLLFSEMRRYPAEEGDLAAVLNGIDFEGENISRVLLALAPSHCFFRELTLPISDRRKLREVLPLELKGETALDTDELVFDALPLPEGKTLAVWSKKAEVAADIATMKDAGFEPQSVSASLFHWGLLLPEGMRGPAALSDGRALAVFRDGEPLFFRALGGDDFVGEIGKSLTALDIARGVRIDTVWLIGDDADLIPAGPVEGINLEPLPATGELDRAFAGSGRPAEAHAGAFALAAAFRRGEVLNFRHGELAYTAGLELAKKKLRFTAILAAVLVVMLFAEPAARWYQAHRDIVSLNGSIFGFYHTIFPNRKKASDEVGEVRAELKRMEGESGGGARVLPVLKKLAEVKGDDIADIYETEIDGTQVRLKGDAKSIQAVNDFKNRVASFLTQAETGEVKSKPDGSVSFSLHGVFKEGER